MAGQPTIVLIAGEPLIPEFAYLLGPVLRPEWMTNEGVSAYLRAVEAHKAANERQSRAFRDAERALLGQRWSPEEARELKTLIDYGTVCHTVRFVR